MTKAILTPAACLVAVAASLFPAPSQSETPQPPLTMTDIEAAWQAQDFATVRSGLETLATQTNSALAQMRYGRVLLEGHGGPKDLPGALHWLEKAANQALPEANTLLARIYLSGDRSGVPRDPERAATLLTNAAARGHAEAQFYLGTLYLNGDGVTANTETAATWLLAAAEQQNPEAQYQLSRLYSKGEGLGASPEATLLWLSRAAENGQRDAQYFLASAYQSGEGIQQNSDLAFHWYLRAAEQGHPLSQRLIGTSYLTGATGPANAADALRWLTAAAEAGDPGAMNNLGFAYASGTVLPKDREKAAFWYDQASNRGVARASLALAALKEPPVGSTGGLEDSVRLYRLALKQGSPAAAEALSRLVIGGRVDSNLVPPHDAVPWVAAAAHSGAADAIDWLKSQAEDGLRPAQAAMGGYLLDSGGDAAEAAALLTSAATDGDVAAQSRLGELFATGTGVPLDYIEAHKWFNVAAASGAQSAAARRDTIAKLMTAEQVAAAQTGARNFFNAAAGRP